MTEYAHFLHDTIENSSINTQYIHKAGYLEQNDMLSHVIDEQFNQEATPLSSDAR
jgi:hypothetical protein